MLMLQSVRHELLLFAAFWFVVWAVDEFAVDLVWLRLWLKVRGQTGRLPAGAETHELSGRCAVMIPAWQEAEVIGATIRHTLAAWRQREMRLYVGCYANDPATLAVAVAAAGGDPRLRIVVHAAHGPTTKADCLNRIYAAMCADEARSGIAFASVVLQDAEDMVHPAGLLVIDRGLAEADFVQLPVRPEVLPRWRRFASGLIAGHYADEFTETHAKAMVVRDALGAALPAAGVGCGFSRAALDALLRARGRDGPFAAECLTEDYELGLLISRAGGRGRFLRVRDSAGALVATRSYFPASLEAAVRQKSRWVHGVALQGWDRLGWGGNVVDIWMALRDRRGPLAAVVLTAGYALVVLEGVLGLCRLAGLRVPTMEMSPALSALLVLSGMAMAWRLLVRMALVGREYGAAEALRTVVRMPLANVIAILAGRRALIAYLRSLRGAATVWDKTAHQAHPATALQPASAA